MPTSVFSPVATILALGALIFVHELGHYLVAKLTGVKVLTFSIGFGPPIFSFRRGETEYRVAWVPLGGYVKMAGADPSEEVAPEDRGRGLLEQRPGKRLLISAAGPAMNLLLPLVLFVGLFWSMNGDPVPAAVVGMVVPGTPAARAGLQPDDRIVAVTGPDAEKRRIRDFDDLVQKVSPYPGQQLTLEVERDGKVLPPMTLRTTSDVVDRGVEMQRRGRLGVAGSYAPARVAPMTRGAAGPLEPFDLVVSVAGAPVKNAQELWRALDGAACGSVDLEVFRERARKLPGVFLADWSRERLAGVPTCVGGKRAIRLSDPMLVAMISAVEPGGPADRAGIRRGDVVTAVNGKPVHGAAELQDRIRTEFASFQPGTLGLEDGRTVPVTPDRVSVKQPLTGKTRTLPTLRLYAGGQALVSEKALAVPTTRRERTPREIVASAGRATVEQIRTMVIGLGKLLTGGIDSSEVGSVISIFRVTKQAVEAGFGTFIVIIAFLSVNLGIMNLLPIPVLDGGQIAQSVVESVTRRPLSVRMREVANVIGLVLIVSLMLFAFKNDIVKLFQGDRPTIEDIGR